MMVMASSRWLVEVPDSLSSVCMVCHVIYG